MTDKTMTLEDRVEFALRDAGFDLDEAAKIAALTSHISQPAERGEAAAWMSCGALTGLPVFTVDAPDDPNVAGWTPLYTAPPPAAGVPDVSPRHPVVVLWRNDALKSAAEIVDRYAKHFPECSGAADDIRAMLSATPSATIDVAAVREVISYLQAGHRFDTEQADKLARAIGDAK